MDDALRQRAELLLELDRDAEAERLIRQGLAAEPGAADLLDQLVRSLTGQGRAQDALGPAHELVAGSPGSDRAHRLLANCLAMLGRTKEAEAEVRRALSIDPENGYNHYLLAFVLKNRVLDGEAKLAALQALEFDPERVPFLLLAGELYLPGDKALAKELFERALRIEPENAAAARGLARANAPNTGLAETVRGLQQSLRLDPTDPYPVYSALEWEARWILFWQRVLVGLSWCLFVLWGPKTWGELPIRLGAGVLLAVGIGFTRRLHAHLPEGGWRLFAGALRRKPALALVAVSTAASFATSALWALAGTEWSAALARIGYAQLAAATVLGWAWAALLFVGLVARALVARVFARSKVEERHG